MIIMDEWIREIKQSEGLRLGIYRCPAGRLTIGYGTNVEYIDQDEAEYLFRHRLEKCVAYIEKMLGETWPKLNSPRKFVLIDMAYQMGMSGLLQFRRMLEALIKGNYQRAADEILDSKYGTSVLSKVRAERNAELMRIGDWLVIINH